MSKLPRVLGLATLMFYGVGVIVGAGIYSVIGAAAAEAGRGIWLSLLIASVPALLAALCYAELSTRFPKAGGTYTFVRESMPTRRLLALVVGGVVAVTAAATVATVCSAFGGYLSSLVAVPGWVGAVVLLGMCALVNAIGLRESSWVTIGCTIIELSGLVLIIVLGVGAGWPGREVLELELGGVLSGAAVLFFVFTGFEGLANLSEESRRPRLHMPVAMLASLGVTTVLYGLVAIAAVELLAPEQLASSQSPLAEAAAAVNPRLAPALAWIALFSTANTALITLVVGSRLLFGMAQQGDVPAVLARTHSTRKTPWVAGLAMALCAGALLPIGGVGVIGSVSSLTTLVVFGAAAACLIVVRRQQRAGVGDLASAAFFRVPVAVRGVPVVAVLLLVSIVALATRFEPRVYLVCGVAIAFVCVLGLAGARNRASVRSGS